MNYFAHKIRALKRWWSILRGNGESKYRIIFFDAPCRLLKIIYMFPAQFINRYFLFYPNKRRLSAFNHLSTNNTKATYFIIVMPHTLHMLIPCIKLVHERINLVLIHNGTKKREHLILKRKFSKIRQFKLATVPFSCYKHGRVIDLLFSAAVGNFGILDHDIYFLNNSCLQDAEFSPNQIMTYILFHINEKTNLVFPSTYFLYFNFQVLKQIISKYRLSFLPYFRVPKHLAKIIHSLGLGPHNFPKSWLICFDTCQIVQAIAFYEKLQYKKLSVRENEVIHIGGTSYGVNPLIRLYMNALFLELDCNNEIRTAYLRKVLGKKTKKEIAEKIITGKNDVTQLVRMNKFFKLLEANLS